MWSGLVRKFFLRFFILVGPDINLLKYNFAVALRISHRRILKLFLFGRFFF